MLSGMRGVNHVILTRFNLPTPGLESRVRAREGWLRERIALFERYCAPSVAAQTTSDLTWLVYFDPETPGWLLHRLQPLIAQDLFRPVFRDSVSTDELIADIADAVHERRDFLITTNLDNDDALAGDFTARLQAAVPPPRTGATAIYLRHGLIKSTNRLYLRTDRRNAFVSVYEPWASAVTSWSEYHNEFHHVMPAIELGGQPAWLQVVHGANVSNRIRGRLVAPAQYEEIFGDLLDDVPPPTMWQIGLDTLICRPIRLFRDGSRTVARKAGLSLLGKARYGRAKQVLAELRNGGRKNSD